MSQLVEIKVPDIGDYKDVPVVEVHVHPGDQVDVEQSLITLESDKATMDVPAPAAGIVREIKLKVGDNVAQGVTILMLEPHESSRSEKSDSTDIRNLPSPENTSSPVLSTALDHINTSQHDQIQEKSIISESAVSTVTAQMSHASPSIRKFARELGVDITQVPGSGPKGRITQSDVQSFIKSIMSEKNISNVTSTSTMSTGELNLLPWPKVDFTKFGPIEAKPLARIKKISAANLSRNWVMIPAVTYHENVDVTELETFRVNLNKENEKLGIKLTLLAFLIKASAIALKQFPEFNSSLDGDQLIFKHYFHIGFAADTPNGLLVPVIRDVDQKGILQIAQETAKLAQLAREGKLKSEQMQGACFTISSLGGIGGTNFAPIINAPEVAILGVSKTTHQPVWDGRQFNPRLIMPLSMTADHRVIDGAMATRFNVFIAQILGDLRRAML